MYDRAYALATGGFIVAALTALFFTAYWLTGIDPDRRPYIVVSSHSVAGLSDGSQVLYRGVPAGRVDLIRIDPENPARVLVSISVDRDIPVHYSTFARLHQRGLTGVAQVELHDTGQHPEPLPTSPADPGRIPMEPSLVDQVTDAGTAALATLNNLADTLQRTLQEENIEQLQTMIARIDSTLAAIEQVADVLGQELPQTLEGATRSVDAVADFAARATVSMNEVDELVAELRETAIVARRLGEQVEGQMAPGLDRTFEAFEAFERAAAEISRLAQTLTREPERILRGSRIAPGPGEE
jgi:phospholipid/cholesterol/gamma-HCH transport system substrate-binding protein